jgi:hypothetical protein
MQMNHAVGELPPALFPQEPRSLIHPPYLRRSGIARAIHSNPRPLWIAMALVNPLDPCGRRLSIVPQANVNCFIGDMMARHRVIGE